MAKKLTALYVAGVMDRNSPQTPPTQEVFNQVMHANVLGAMQALPQVAPWVAEADGTFAFISSRMASLELTDNGRAALYKVSKAALNMVVRTAPFDFPNVTWLALSPGWVQTDMGGRNALIDAHTSVTGLRKVIENLSLENTGRFIAYDGKEIAW